jgi:hypothetical protein
MLSSPWALLLIEAKNSGAAAGENAIVFAKRNMAFAVFYTSYTSTNCKNMRNQREAKTFVYL